MFPKKSDPGTVDGIAAPGGVGVDGNACIGAIGPLLGALGIGQVGFVFEKADFVEREIQDPTVGFPPHGEILPGEEGNGVLSRTALNDFLAQGRSPSQVGPQEGSTGVRRLIGRGGDKLDSVPVTGVRDLTVTGCRLHVWHG